MVRFGLKATVVAASILLGAGAAQAATFSFLGDFSTDDEVQQFTFVLAERAAIVLRSLSYAGGVNAAGELIASGGFDPAMAVFDHNGSRIHTNDDARRGQAGIDPLSGLFLDTYLAVTLAPGHYTVALSQSGNRPLDALDDPFSQEGNFNFTARNRCSNGRFCDSLRNNRTSQWAFDIINVDTAIALGVDDGGGGGSGGGVGQAEDVPLPGAVFLFAAGLAGMAGLSRRKRKAGLG